MDEQGKPGSGSAVDPASPTTLSTLRSSIDLLDERLLELLNERAGVVRAVAEWKERRGEPFFVPDRERQIVERLGRIQAERGGAFPAEAIAPVFAEVISACLSLEQRLRVAYLGPEATYTHQAARSRFGRSARYVPAAIISGVFDEVQKGNADVGVVPIENSTEGVVNHTLDEFMDSPLVVRQEIVIEVSHALLGRAAGLADVQKIYSHPQALAQCRRWLAANLPSVPLVEVASTAQAARLAKDDPGAAAIASELAGQIYDLPVLRPRIADALENVTRFLVIGPPGERKSPGSAGVAAPPPPSLAIAEDGRPVEKTSIMFTLRDRPGGLHQALAPFAAHGINLSRIESRPSRRRAWDYVFFIDLDGHAASPRVAAALAALAPGCDLVKVLGSYARAEAALRVAKAENPNPQT